MLLRGCGTMRMEMSLLMWLVVVVLVLAVVPIVLMLLWMKIAMRLDLTRLPLTSWMPVVPITVLVVLTVLTRFPALITLRVTTRILVTGASSSAVVARAGVGLGIEDPPLVCRMADPLAALVVVVVGCSWACPGVLGDLSTGHSSASL